MPRQALPGICNVSKVDKHPLIVKQSICILGVLKLIVIKHVGECRMKDGGVLSGQT